jgi:hypothetical protein
MDVSDFAPSVSSEVASRYGQKDENGEKSVLIRITTSSGNGNVDRQMAHEWLWTDLSVPRAFVSLGDAIDKGHGLCEINEAHAQCNRQRIRAPCYTHP